MQAFHLIGAAPFYTNSFLLITEADHAVIIDPAAEVQEYDKILREKGAVLTHILSSAASGAQRSGASPPTAAAPSSSP